MADVVGYSRLIETDETGTLAVLKERWTSILDPTVRSHGGRIVKLMGDGVLVEFASAVNAVAAAAELQRKMADANTGLPEPPFRKICKRSAKSRASGMTALVVKLGCGPGRLDSPVSMQKQTIYKHGTCATQLMALARAP